MTRLICPNCNERLLSKAQLHNGAKLKCRKCNARFQFDKSLLMPRLEKRKHLGISLPIDAKAKLDTLFNRLCHTVHVCVFVLTARRTTLSVAVSALTVLLVVAITLLNPSHDPTSARFGKPSLSVAVDDWKSLLKARQIADNADGGSDDYQTYSRSLEVDPLPAFFLNERGFAALQATRYTEAADDFRASIHCSTYFFSYPLANLPIALAHVGDSSAMFEAAMWAAESGDILYSTDWTFSTSDQAISHWRETAKRSRACPIALFMLGRQLCHTGEFVKALHSIDAAIRNAPEVPVLHCLRSVIQQRLGDWSGAVKSASNACQLAPQLAYPRYVLATAEQGFGRLDAAVRSFSRAIDGWQTKVAASARISPRLLANAHAKRSQCFDALGQRRRAVGDLFEAERYQIDKWYTRFSANNPIPDWQNWVNDRRTVHRDDEVAAYFQCTNLMNSHQWDEAERELMRLKALMPNEPRISMWLGVVAMRKSPANIVASQRCFEDALHLDANDAAIRFFQAMSSFENNDTASATRQLRYTTELAPDFPHAWRELGLATLNRDQYDSAASAFSIAMRIYASHDLFADARQYTRCRYNRAVSLSKLNLRNESEHESKWLFANGDMDLKNAARNLYTNVSGQEAADAMFGPLQQVCITCGGSGSVIGTMAMGTQAYGANAFGYKGARNRVTRLCSMCGGTGVIAQ